MMAYDDAHDQIVCFGGFHPVGGQIGGTSDTWTYRVPCAADLDLDGAVGLSDLTLLLANFGASRGAIRADGDLDGDGDVDIWDLTQLLGVFGTACP
jgi:hypothetical protein